MLYELKKSKNGYNVSIYDLIIEDKKNKRVVYKKMENMTLDKAADFLEHEGVDPEEVDVALEEMVKRNHNKASFGVQGGFVCTSKE